MIMWYSLIDRLKKNNSYLNCFFLISLLLINSCKKEKPDNQYYFLNVNSFFASNKYDSTVFYKNQKMIGKNRWNGDLMIKTTYYENGQLHSYREFVSGREMGNVYYFFMNGQIKHYNFTDDHNRAPYVLDWDSLGNIIKEQGLAISPNMTSDMESTDLRKGDTLAIHTTFPSPPDTYTILFGGYKDKNHQVIDSIKLSPIRNTVYYKSVIMTKDSIYPFFTGILYDKNGNVKQKSYFEVSIFVK